MSDKAKKTAKAISDAMNKSLVSGKRGVKAGQEEDSGTGLMELLDSLRGEGAKKKKKKEDEEEEPEEFTQALEPTQIVGPN